MSRAPRLLLALLLLGGGAAAVAIGLTVLGNWLFRGEARVSGDQVARLAILGSIVAMMPLGLVWARSRKERAESRGGSQSRRDATGGR